MILYFCYCIVVYLACNDPKPTDARPSKRARKSTKTKQSQLNSLSQDSPLSSRDGQPLRRSTRTKRAPIDYWKVQVEYFFFLYCCFLLFVIIDGFFC